MSAGGQNGSNLGGLQGLRIQYPSDVVARARVQLMFTTNVPVASGYVGGNSYRSKGIQNSAGFLFQVQQGVRECLAVTGQPYAMTTSSTMSNTIPVTNQFP